MSGATGSRSSGSTCATRRASRRSARTCSRRGSGSTSSSTTPARPFAGRPSSTGTCSRASSQRPGAMPAHVRRLLGEYEGLRRTEMLPAGSAELSQVALLPEDTPRQSDLFPEGRLDQDLQQVDLRDRNSWRLLLDEVSSVELLETQLVNAVAPFVLNARLKPLLLRAPRERVTSTSSTCQPSRGSSTGASRPPGIRTRTWRRRR